MENVARSPEAKIEDNVLIGPQVVIGPGVQIGTGTQIHPGAVIGPGVKIGRNCHIGPHASIFFSLIGDGVTILGGARLGETGFGLAVGPAGAVQTPHFGRVIVQDNVVIGANTCVDRGLFDDTVIMTNAKIDNLSQNRS